MSGPGVGSRLTTMLLSGLALGSLGLLEPLIRFWPAFHLLGKSWIAVVLLYLACGLVCSFAAGLFVTMALATRAVQRRPVVYASYYFAGAFALAAVLVTAPLLRHELNALLISVSYWVIYPALLLLGIFATAKLTPHLLQPILATLIGYPSGRISHSRLTLLLVIVGLFIPLTAFKSYQAQHLPRGRAPRAGLQSRPGDQPVQNLMWITIGGLRADHVGAYGYTRPTTPVIDSLASQGVLFERCFAQGSRNELSLGSIFTSLYPGAHGVRFRDEREVGLAPDYVTLAEGLHDAGLRCVGLFNGPFLNRHSGFAQGFSEVVEFHHGYLELFPWRYLLKLKVVSPPEQIPQSDYFRAGMVVDEAIGRLARLRGRPFFLYVNLVDTHQPFIPPSRYESAFLSPGATSMSGEEIWRKRWPIFKDLPSGETLSAADRLRFIDLYDGALRYVDAEVGRLLSQLELLGLAHNTMVVVTSERGMEFLDHGQMLNYTELLYDELIHVPLIIRMPQIEAGRRIEPIVRHVDLMPTLYEIFSLPPERRTHGQSLEPLLTGRGDWRMATAYSESYEYASLRTPTHKTMISKHGAEESLCFDLTADPRERTNIFAADPSGACDSLTAVITELRRGF